MKGRREFEAHRHLKDNSVTTKKRNGNKKKPEIPMITEESLKDARTAIAAGKEQGSLENADLVEEVLEKLKGRNMQAASEVVIAVSCILPPSALMFRAKEMRELSVLKAIHQLSHKEVEENTEETK